MIKSETRQKVAAQVRDAIARRGWGQADLARATGIATSALSRKLRGQVPFYVDELLCIAAALEVDPGVLLPDQRRPPLTRRPPTHPKAPAPTTK